MHCYGPIPGQRKLTSYLKGYCTTQFISEMRQGRSFSQFMKKKKKKKKKKRE
jgi:hypothetical protein